MRVHESGRLGEGFRAVSNGALIPTYCIVPARRNIVTVVTPDGKVHRFEAEAPDACEIFSPPDFVELAFRAIDGTTSSLEATDLGELNFVQGEILDANGGISDPRAYTLTTADGRKLSFDQYDGFIQIEDTNGNRLDFSDNGIVHSSGKSIQFDRDDAGRITGIADPQGHRIEYAYDPDGNLVAVTDREGN